MLALFSIFHPPAQTDPDLWMRSMLRRSSRTAAALVLWGVTVVGFPASARSFPSVMVAPRRPLDCDASRTSQLDVSAHQGEVHREMRHGEIGGRRSRRAVLAAIASSATLFTATSASAAVDFDADAHAPFSDLARQIRTGVVRGARLVDRADKAWERFSDDRGLGAARNRPKRNVLDAGGNQLAKEVVRSPTSEAGEFDEAFAAGALQQCDEAFLSCLEAQAQLSMTPGRRGISARAIDRLRQRRRRASLDSAVRRRGNGRIARPGRGALPPTLSSPPLRRHQL